MKSVVSVIVPVYGVEPYLSACVDSILTQTHRELEVILIDDGSPDQCGMICDAYAARDSRVRVIHQANAGAANAKNTGLDAAGGEYIAFADSDDWVESDWIEKTSRWISSTSRMLGWACRYSRIAEREFP